MYNKSVVLNKTYQYELCCIHR